MVDSILMNRGGRLEVTGRPAGNGKKTTKNLPKIITRMSLRKLDTRDCIKFITYTA